jgi:hypothetical protein
LRTASSRAGASDLPVPAYSTVLLMICVADEKIVLIPVTRAMLIIIAARDRPGWTRSAADQRGEKGDRDEHGQYATQYEPECVALRLTRVLPVSHRGREHRRVARGHSGAAGSRYADTMTTRHQPRRRISRSDKNPGPSSSRCRRRRTPIPSPLILTVNDADRPSHHHVE